MNDGGRALVFVVLHAPDFQWSLRMKVRAMFRR